MWIETDTTVDLHTHTLYSDGHWQPEELLAQLAREGIAVAAITDHDTVEHVEELRAKGRELGVHLLAGTEVTTSWHGLPAHLLCYSAALTSDALAALIQSTVERQLDNTRQVYLTLVEERGFAFPLRRETLRERDGAVVRPIDNALLLVRHGYAPDIAHALQMIRDAGYVQMMAPIEEAVAAAHASGAVTLLAHPGRGGGEIHRYDPDQIEEMLADIPLDGIEVYYPTHTPAQTEAYKALARRRDLLVSAGSDSHGPRQRLPVPYSARCCAALLERCGVRVR